MLVSACERTPASDRTDKTTATECNLNAQPCVVASRWGTITVDLSPRPLPVLQPIAIELRLDNPAALDATAELIGADMDMGPNTARLERIGTTQQRGQLIIPICLTGAMNWRLKIHLRDATQNETLAFNFVAPHEHAGKSH